MALFTKNEKGKWIVTNLPSDAQPTSLIVIKRPDGRDIVARIDMLVTRGDGTRYATVIGAEELATGSLVMGAEE